MKRTISTVAVLAFASITVAIPRTLPVVSKETPVLQSSLCTPNDWPLVPGSSPPLVATTDSLLPGNARIVTDQNWFVFADAALLIDAMPAEQFSSAEFSNPGIEVVIESPQGVSFSPIAQGDKFNATTYEVCDGSSWVEMPTTPTSSSFHRARISQAVTQQLVSGGAGTNGKTFHLGLKYEDGVDLDSALTIRVIAFATQVLTSARSNDWTVAGMAPGSGVSGRFEDSP